VTLFKRATFYGDPAYNPFERPSMPLASLALDGVLGGGQNNDSGEPVDPVKGMAIPTAYRCLTIISTVLASCILEEMAQSNGDAERWDVLDGLISYTAFELMEIVGAHLGGWGNFFARETMINGKLADLAPIFPGDVTVLRIKGVKTFRIRKRNDDGSIATTADSGGSNGSAIYDDIPDGPNCPIFHIPGFGYDGLQGMSPILLAAQTFGTTVAADRLAARFYSKGQQLGGVLKVKVPLANQSQADAMKMQWATSHGGVGNAGGIAILDSETDFQPITIAPNALQFLESRQWQASEIAKMFGLPAFMISEQTTWGSGIEQQWQGFITMTLRSYTDRIEQRFTRRYSKRGKYLEFDLDRLMRGSTMERFQAYGQAIGWGWMTRAEVRSKERMKSMPEKFGLDQPLTPQAMNGALQDGPMAAAGGNKPTGAQAAGTPNPNGPAPTGPQKPPAKGQNK
jgi:HK97 family phage portal protein